MNEAMAGSAGLPLSVQLVGRHWKDEVVLRGMMLLENARGTLEFPPEDENGPRPALTSPGAAAAGSDGRFRSSL